MHFIILPQEAAATVKEVKLLYLKSLLNHGDEKKLLKLNADEMENESKQAALNHGLWCAFWTEHLMPLEVQDISLTLWASSVLSIDSL